MTGGPWAHALVKADTTAPSATAANVSAVASDEIPEVNTDRVVPVRVRGGGPAHE
jgi:hypothetical protein